MFYYRACNKLIINVNLVTDGLNEDPSYGCDMLVLNLPLGRERSNIL